MKKIFTALKEYIDCRKFESILIKRARKCFLNKYPDRIILSRRMKPQKTKRGFYIVTIFFDNKTRPLGRTWWKVCIDSEKVNELSYDEADKLIKIPLWR